MPFSTSAIVGKAPLLVALAFLIGLGDDLRFCSASAEPKGAQTTAERSSSPTAPSTKAPAPSVTAGKSPDTKSAGKSKPAKSRKTGRKSSKPSKKNQVRGQREIEPSRVLEIQQALRSAGYYQGEPSGKWDVSTTQAMTAYQTDNGFKVTGKPDALSLKKLGL